jgi:hypothetical protein
LKTLWSVDLVRPLAGERSLAIAIDWRAGAVPFPDCIILR